MYDFLITVSKCCCVPAAQDSAKSLIKCVFVCVCGGGGGGIIKKFQAGI